MSAFDEDTRAEFGWGTEDNSQFEDDQLVVEERGFFGDLGTGLLRGGVAFTGMVAEGAEALGLDNSVDEWASNVRHQSKWLADDVSEFRGEQGFLKKSFQGAIEALPASIAPAIPGALAGGAIAGPVGAVAGGLLSMAGIIGLGEGHKSYEEGLEKGLTKEEATEYGWKKGVTEAGLETLAMGVDILTAKAGGFAIRGAKQTMKQLLKRGPKAYAKDMAVIIGTENVTEQAQLEVAHRIDQAYGLAKEGEDVSWGERLEVIGTTTMLSMMFGTAAVGYNMADRASLKKGLESSDRPTQIATAKIIHERLKKQDPEVAKQWNTYIKDAVDNDVKIRIDEEFSEKSLEISKFGESKESLEKKQKTYEDSITLPDKPKVKAALLGPSTEETIQTIDDVLRKAGVPIGESEDQQGLKVTEGSSEMKKRSEWVGQAPPSLASEEYTKQRGEYEDLWLPQAAPATPKETDPKLKANLKKLEDAKRDKRLKKLEPTIREQAPGITSPETIVPEEAPGSPVPKIKKKAVVSPTPTPKAPEGEITTPEEDVEIVAAKEEYKKAVEKGDEKGADAAMGKLSEALKKRDQKKGSFEEETVADTPEVTEAKQTLRRVSGTGEQPTQVEIVEAKEVLKEAGVDFKPAKTTKEKAKEETDKRVAEIKEGSTAEAKEAIDGKFEKTSSLGKKIELTYEKLTSRYIADTKGLTPQEVTEKGIKKPNRKNARTLVLKELIGDNPEAQKLLENAFADHERKPEEGYTETRTEDKITWKISELATTGTTLGGDKFFITKVGKGRVQLYAGEELIGEFGNRKAAMKAAESSDPYTVEGKGKAWVAKKGGKALHSLKLKSKVKAQAFAKLHAMYPNLPIVDTIRAINKDTKYTPKDLKKTKISITKEVKKKNEEKAKKLIADRKAKKKLKGPKKVEEDLQEMSDYIEPTTEGKSVDLNRSTSGARVLSGNGKTLGLTLHHGSAKKFSSFLKGMIGTGNEATGHGFGHYFGTTKGIADFFRKQVTSEGATTYKGKSLHDFFVNNKTPEGSVIGRLKYLLNEGGITKAKDSLKSSIENSIKKNEKALSVTEGDLKTAEEALKKKVGFFKRKPEDHTEGFKWEIDKLEGKIRKDKDTLKALSELNKEDFGGGKEGHMYVVDTNLTDEEFLDLNESLSNQSNLVKEALGDFKPEDTGRFIHDSISKELGSDKKAAEYLMGRGVMGNKVRDDLVTDGKESYYIIFSDDDVKITDRVDLSDMDYGITQDSSEAWGELDDGPTMATPPDPRIEKAGSYFESILSRFNILSPEIFVMDIIEVQNGNVIVESEDYWIESMVDNIRLKDPNSVFGSAGYNPETNQVVFALNTRMMGRKTEADLVELIAHEAGHILERVDFHQAPKAEQDKIIAAYEAHLRDNIRGTNISYEELIHVSRAERLATGWSRAMEGNQTLRETNALQYLGRKKFQYYTSFSEWYADQVSKWETGKKPIGVLEKLWDRILKAWTDIYEITKGNYSSTKAFAEFMDGRLKVHEASFEDIVDEAISTRAFNEFHGTMGENRNRFLILTEEMEFQDIEPLEDLKVEANVPFKKVKETPEDAEANFKRQGERGYTFRKGTRALLDETKKSFKNALASGIDRIEAISPQIARKVNNYVKGISEKNAEYKTRINTFSKLYKKLDVVTRGKLGVALYNGKLGDIDKIVKDNPGLEGPLLEVQAVLGEIKERALAVGLTIDEVQDLYFPRTVTDPSALKALLQGKGGNLGLLEDAIEEAKLRAKKLGVSFSPAHEEELINSILATGRYYGSLQIPGSLKTRTITTIDSKMYEHYSDPIASLHDHILQMNDAIGAQELIGTKLRKGAIGRIRKLESDYGKASGDRKKALGRQIAEERQKFNSTDAGSIMEESLAAYIKKLTSDHSLTFEEADEIIHVVRSRLLQKGMSGFQNRLRNVGLMSTLADFTSLITQASEVILSTFANNPTNALMGMVRKKEIDAAVLDLKNQQLEFQGEGSAKYVSKLLDATGFSKVDIFMKESFMNAALIKARKDVVRSPEKFKEEWGGYFGDDFNSLVKELKSSEKGGRYATELAWAKQMRFQPLDVIANPTAYMTGGNLRLLYMLKTFQLRQANALYRESIGKMTKGNIQGGLKGMILLSGLIVLGGAGKDELRDLWLGREVPMGDHIWDNVLNIFLLSRYDAERFASDGIGAQLLGKMIPPTPWLDDPGRDLMKWYKGEESYRSLKLLPVLGKVLYDRFTEAGNLQSTNVTKGFALDRVRKAVRSGDRQGLIEARKAIRESNKGKDKEERITTSTISRTISAERKKIKKTRATPKLSKLSNKYSKRLGVTSDTAEANMMKFVEIVGWAENTGKLKGNNIPQKGKEGSTAKGLYQIVDKTMEPSLNRLARTIGWEPWMKSARTHKDANKLNWEQQTLVLMGQLFELDGSDKYVKGMLEGDVEAMGELYYDFHHTRPDAKTKANWKRAVDKFRG